MSEFLPGVNGPATGYSQAEASEHAEDLVLLVDATANDSDGSTNQVDGEFPEENVVEETYFVADSQDTILFVARATSSDLAGTDAIHERLRESLLLTSREYEKAYAEIQCDVEYLTFVQSSDRAFVPYVEAKFAELFAKQDSVDARLIAVMNVFDGLTTHEASLYYLLEGHTHMCEFFVFEDHPGEEVSRGRRFFQVDTDQACQIRRGDKILIYDAGVLDEVESDTRSGIVYDDDLEFSTALYVRAIRYICQQKRGVSKHFQKRVS
jgi:hypothetical protein